MQRGKKYQGESMKKIRTSPLLLLTFFAALAAAACTPQSSFAQQNRETILRLHGSNTIGARLAPDLAKAFLRKLGAASVRQKDIAAGTETDIEGDFPEQQRIKVIEIRAHGSSTAFKGLKDGKCDIGMSSRKIKASEAEELAFLGDMSGSASEHVLALDGVAVIVNPANAALWKMDFARLADVFSGKIKNWSELGGASAPIVIHARDGKSGTHDTFQSLVLGKQELAASAVRHESNDALSAAVSADVNAIGYCGLAYVQRNKALALADGGRAVPPTVSTVAGEEYPVSRRLHLYTPAVPGNPYIQDFIAFALSQEGQEKVKEGKFVDLTIAPRGAKTVGSTSKLSVSFRFKGETLELDNRSLRDLDRLADFLAEQKKKSAELILTGYSDSQDGYAQSLDLSCKRAAAVKEELLSRGIKVADVRCMGQDGLIASSSTEQGREKNGRVEVWVR
jgi:phosphate transport system substrate-binding protein